MSINHIYSRKVLESTKFLQHSGSSSSPACPTTLRKPSKASKTEGLSSFRPTSATPFIGILGTYRQHHEIHTLSEAKFGFTRVMMEEMCMMVSIIAGFDPDNLHPRLAALDDTTLAQVTKGSTVSIVIPEGPFCRELGRLCDQDCMLIFGTSANATGQGQRFRLEDVGDEVLAHADLLVDYGLQKWHTYGSGAVNFHAQNIRVLRKGVAWEVFMDRAKRWFPQLLGEARGSFE